MFMLDRRGERLVGIALVCLMAATRIHHFGVGTIAPDASTAVFLLAGLLLASPLWLPVLLAEAVALDVLAIGLAGVAAACVTGGYLLLPPAYAALWLSGRAIRPLAGFDLPGAARFLVAAVVGTVCFFVIANLGYFLGSEYRALGWFQYAQRVSQYFPYYLGITLTYAVAGIALLWLAKSILGRRAPAAR